MRVFQIQRVSAVALLVFMTMHMVVVHYPPGHIDFNRIIVRMEQPIWKALDIAFLFTVLIHALSGAYMVLTDVEKVYKVRKVLAVVAIVVFVGAFIVGTWTILSFQAPV